MNHAFVLLERNIASCLHNMKKFFMGNLLYVVYCLVWISSTCISSSNISLYLAKILHHVVCKNKDYFPIQSNPNASVGKLPTTSSSILPTSEVATGLKMVVPISQKFKNQKEIFTFSLFPHRTSIFAEYH